MNKNDFAKTPPCGWNSYDYYDTAVNEDQVRANAKYMAEHLKEYGFEYVIVDIEWYSNDAATQRDKYQYIPFGDDQMDEYGRFQPSPSRFPSSADGSGFKNLANYIHSLGLKFGIHIMRGIPRLAANNHCPIYGSNYKANEVADPSSICGWNPDMYGVRNTEGGQAYYDSIISMYADWGVDFIKCDDICDSWMYRNDNFNGWFETKMLHKAIMKTGRPIVLSLSPGPAHVDRAYEYCANANMWRITDDFWDDWKYLKEMFYRCEKWQDHVRKGCFPDCDMLPLGKIGKGFNDERDSRLSYDEKKTMLTLWCMFRSPLMLGAELTLLDADELKLITNKEILKLLDENHKGEQLLRNESQAIWLSTDASSRESVIAFFNLMDHEQNITFDLCNLENINIEEKITMTELWDNSSIQVLDHQLAIKVPSHGVKVYKILN